MSLLRRERRTANLDALTRILQMSGYTPRGMRSGSAYITDDKALTLSAVWACVRLLSDNVAGLPVDVYRKVGDRRIEVTPQPPMVAAPSALVSRSTWVYQQMVSMLLRGNGYGLATQVGIDGWPTKVEIVHPDTFQVRQPDQLAPPEYRYQNMPVDYGQVYHVSAYNIPGSVVGLSPIAYAARTLGIGISAEEYGEDVLGGGGHPTGLLTSTMPLDGDAAKIAKSRFKDATAGDHLAVLGGGWGYQSVQLTPAESQFLETHRVNDVDICRFFGVPASKIDAAVQGQSITYSNREQDSIEFLVSTLQWWVTRIEEAWSALLPRGQYVKLNTDAIVRVDLATQINAFDKAIRMGISSRDEIRALRDEPPIPDGTGGEFLWPPYRAFPLPSEDDQPQEVPTGA